MRIAVMPLAKVLGGQAVLIAIALAAGYLAQSIGVPGGWVVGAMLGVAVCAMLVPLPEATPLLRDTALLLGGAAMGASVQPETLTIMASFPASFLGLALTVTATIAVSARFLHRRAGWKPLDAVLGATPGALSSVFAVGAERGADLHAIGVVQNIRVVALLIAVPALPFLVGSATVSPHAAQALIGPLPLLAMLALGAGIGLVLEALQLPAGLLVGGTLGAAALTGSGAVAGVLPAPVAIGGFVLIGVFVGARFGGIRWSDVLRHARAGLASFVIAMVVAAIGAALVANLLDLRFGSVLLAYLPGALEAVAVLAIVLDLDPLYVGAHHIARLIGIALALPFVARWLAR